MRSATWIVGALLATAGGCLESGEGGNIGVVDVADGVSLDADTTATDTAVVDTTAVDTSPPADTAVADTADTTPVDIGQDTSVVPGCGDGVLSPGEACDDGNACDLDGCRAMSCMPIPTVVLTDLALDPGVAYDLDDADGDGDPATGGDNRLGGSALVASVVNPLITQAIENGQVIQLATLGGLDNPASDDAVTLALHPGVDPDCPSTRPPTWLEADVPALLYSDRSAWETCEPHVSLAGRVAPTSPTSTSPEPPVLVADTTDPVVIPAGTLGDLEVARSHLEAHVVGTSGVVGVVALEDGQLSGVIPASALYRIDTSSLLSGCPTALHAVLALVGHIDQDAEGNGAKDWIQFTLGGSQPCLGDPVTIVGCCNDGDCDDFVAGSVCALDARIGDGFSAGFRFSAKGAHVTAQVHGATYCSP